jgi:hypothetical protein
MTVVDYSAGEQVEEVRADTRRVWRVDIPARNLVPRVAVRIDGLGRGAGPQTLRPVLYNSAGALLSTGSAFVVEKNDPARMQDLVFPDVKVLAAGSYIIGLHADGVDRTARVWGSDLHAARANDCINPHAVAKFSWATWQGGYVSPSAYVASTASPRPTPESPGYLEVGPFDATSANYVLSGPWGGPATKPVVAGQRVFLRMGVYIAAATGLPSSARIAVGARYTKADGTYHSEVMVTPELGAVQSLAVGRWYYPFGWLTVPAGAETVAVMGRVSSLTGATGITVRFAAAQFDRYPPDGVTVLPYGDGRSPGWAWEGAADNSMSRGPYGRINRVMNPRPEVGGTAFAMNNVVATIEADPSSPTGRRVRLHTATQPDAFVYLPPHGSVAEMAYGAVAGETWTLVAWVKANAAAMAMPQNANTNNSVSQLTLWHRTASSGAYTISKAPRPAVADVWERTAVQVTLPTDATAFFSRLYHGGDGAVYPGAEVHFAGVRMYKGTIADLEDFDFDGDSPGAQWLGTAAASLSIKWQAAELPDTYADGPAAAAGTPAALIPPGVASVIELTPEWVPPLIPDEELAARGWHSSQLALRGNIESASDRTVTAEWHGTSLDERRGAFALVREGGPLEELVGERVRVTRRSREAYVYIVGSTDDMDEDLSLTRRAWMALADAAEESIDLRLQVVTGATL